MPGAGQGQPALEQVPSTSQPVSNRSPTDFVHEHDQDGIRVCILIHLLSASGNTEGHRQNPQSSLKGEPGMVEELRMILVMAHPG